MRFLLIGKGNQNVNGNALHWFTTVDNLSSQGTSVSVAGTSLNNSVLGFRDTTSSGMYIISFDSSGNILNQTDLLITTDPTQIPSIEIHSDNTVSSILSRHGIVRTTSGLTVTNSKFNSGANGTRDMACCAIDTSGNTYIAYSDVVGAVSSTIVVKLDSSFSVTWAKSFKNASTLMIPQPQQMKVNSSGTIIVGINTPTQHGAICIDTNGNHIWTRILANRTLVGVGIDNSGNGYLVLQNNSGPIVNIFKVNSSGTTVWKKRLPTGTSIECADCSGAGEVYLGKTAGNLYKLDVNGNFSQGRSLTYNGTIVPVNAIKILSSNKVLLSGAINTNGNVTVSLLPEDTSLNGNYGLLNYNTSGTTTVTTSSETLSNLTPTVANYTESTTSYTITPTTPTFSQTIQDIE